MNTRAGRTPKGHSPMADERASRQRHAGAATVGLEDHRPSALAQRRLQSTIDTGSRSLAAATLQAMAHQSPKSRHAAQLQAMADARASAVWRATGAGAPFAGMAKARAAGAGSRREPSMPLLARLARAQAAAGAPVLQARFDPQDIDKMRAVATDDPALSRILEEVIAIHDRMPEDINYGVSTKGGHAALNSQGKGQVVVKDERWSLTKKIKDYFNAYGMAHDIERQSMIIHELTHLAELYANLPSEQGVVPEAQRPKNDKDLAEAMEPDKALVDEVYKEKGAVEKLLDDSDYDAKMKTYLRGRLEYGFAINAENPTVFTEIGYYLKAHGKGGTPFYDKIMAFADAFYRSRQERLAARQGH